MRYGRLIPVLLVFFAAAGCGPDAAFEPTARVGEPAPPFTVELTSGGSVSAEELKGKPLVLTFMAEWCPCSNESAPVFKEVYSRYNPEGVEFLMLGFQDSRSKFGEFVEREAFPFLTGFDT
ncbi:MAG: TlpA disulfide reductase family protein, partial [Thermodesulfobacteriota bacterium]